MLAVKDKVHENMYRVQWEDGTCSTDFYNLPRTQEFIFLLKQREKKQSLIMQIGETCEFSSMSGRSCGRSS